MARFESIIDEINHYRRLAEDKSATQAERELAQHRLEKLMIRHAISESDLDDGSKDGSIMEHHIYFPKGMRHAKYRVLLAHHIAKGVGLASVYAENTLYNEPETGEATYGSIAYMYGDYDRLVLAHELFHQLDSYMAIGWTSFRSLLFDTPTTAQKNGFFLGFISEAHRRIDELYKAEVEEALGEERALAIIDETKKYINFMYSKHMIKNARSRKVDYLATINGANTARNADYGTSSKMSLKNQLEIEA